MKLNANMQIFNITPHSVIITTSSFSFLLIILCITINIIIIIININFGIAQRFVCV